MVEIALQGYVSFSVLWMLIAAITVIGHTGTLATKMRVIVVAGLLWPFYALEIIGHMCGKLLDSVVKATE